MERPRRKRHHIFKRFHGTGDWKSWYTSIAIKERSAKDVTRFSWESLWIPGSAKKTGTSGPRTYPAGGKPPYLRRWTVAANNYSAGSQRPPLPVTRTPPRGGGAYRLGWVPERKCWANPLSISWSIPAMAGSSSLPACPTLSDWRGSRGRAERYWFLVFCW